MKWLADGWFGGGARCAARLVLGSFLAVCLLGTSRAASPEADPQVLLSQELSFFYTDPDPDRVPALLENFDTLGALRGKPEAQSPLIGFLAALLADNPDSVESWLAEPHSREVQAVIGHALVRAGMGERMAAYLADNGWKQAEIDTVARTPSGLLSGPMETAEELDMLWGAGFASGDRRYLAKIVDFVAATLDEGKFSFQEIAFAGRVLEGPDAVAVGRGLRDRPDGDILVLAAVGSAVWSLGSNAVQHPFVMELVRDRMARADGSELGELLRKSLLFSRAPRVVPIQGEAVHGLVAQTATDIGAADIGQGKDIDPLLAAFDASVRREFAGGEPVFITVILIVPPGPSGEVRFSVATPQGGTFTLAPVRWQGDRENQKVLRISVPIEASRLTESGTYTVDGVFVAGGDERLESRGLFFVGD